LKDNSVGDFSCSFRSETASFCKDGSHPSLGFNETHSVRLYVKRLGFVETDRIRLLFLMRRTRCVFTWDGKVL